MIKRVLLLTIALVLFLAAPVLAYLYRAPYVITETDNTSYDMLGLIGASNNDWMAANGFMKTTALDTRVETLGGVAQPHLVAGNMTLTAMPINGGSQTNLFFTTGNSDLTSMDIITGYGGSVSTTDDADIEPSDNATIQFTDAWLDADAGASKYLARKPADGATGGLDVFVDNTTSGNVTAKIQDTDFITQTLPTGASGWTNSANATDGDTGTYASATAPGAGASAYLTLTIDSTVCNQIRYWIAQENPGVTWDIDVYYSAGWHSLVSDAAVTAGSYQTSTMGIIAGVTQVRMRAYGNGNNWYVRVHEVNVGAVPERQVSTTSISSEEHDVTVRIADNVPVMATGDVLKFDGTAGSYIDTGAISSSYIAVSFFFVLDVPHNAGSGVQRYFLSDTASGNDFLQMYFHTTGQMYFRYYINPPGIIFSLNTVQTSWDANTLYHVYAATGQAIAGGAASDGARLRINNGTALTSADTTAIPLDDLIIGSESTTHANGLDGTIFNFVVLTDNVTEAEENALYQGIAPADAIEIWPIDEGAGTSIYSYGSSATTATAGGSTSWDVATYTGGNTGRLCDFTIQIDSERWGTNLKGVSVPNNNSDWYWLQNNSVPYVGSIELSVGGSRQLYYAPNDMISGTVLPDRETNGGAENGAFSWGANPAGVGVSLGSMVSSGTPALGVTEARPTPDTLPAVNSSAWFPDPATSATNVTGNLLTNPMRPLVTILSDTTTINEVQAWRLLGLAFVLLAFVGTAKALRGHLAISGIIGGVAWGVLVSMDSSHVVFPLWTLVLLIVPIVGALVSERTPSVG